MIHATYYDTTTGEIDHIAVCLDDIVPPAPPGQAIYLGELNMATDYVDPVTGEPATKTLLGATVDKTSVTADGVDLVTITGLANPTKVRVTGPNGETDYQVTDGTLELSFSTPGTYRVRMFAPRRQGQWVDINAS